MTAPASSVAVTLKASGKWSLCGLLFLATTLNYLDRRTMSILAPTIQQEMGFDKATLGWLFSIFYYTYTISRLAVGIVLDRTHLRWAYGLAVPACSAAGTASTVRRGAARRDARLSPPTSSSSTRPDNASEDRGA